MNHILCADDVWIDYGQGPVLCGVNLSWDEPGTTSIVGASGSGKTTLLYALAGLEALARGTVYLTGTNLSSLSPDDVCRLRLENVGFVFQQSDLVSEFTLAQNIELPLRLLKWPMKTRRKRVEELIERLNLEECAQRRPGAVSGGQAQRAAIARAVSARPKIVFADEPTGSLDSVHGEQVIDLLVEQCMDTEALLVLVTHDEGIASRMDRVIRLMDGRVVSDLLNRAPAMSRHA